MASVVPDAKLIYMVRDPLERIAAHWVHNYAKRREKGTLAETLVHPNTTYVTRSKYAMQLERFLEHYPKEQVLVFQQSELRHKRMETLRQIFEFIGVDPDFNHPRFEQERHQTSGKTRATRLAVRLERMGRGRRGRLFPSNFWLVLDDRLPLRRAIKRPDVKAALPPRDAGGAACRRRALARADRARLLQLEDLALVEGPRGSLKTTQQHRHPGGSGAVLGVGVMRNSSVQAVSLIVANADGPGLGAGRRRLPRAEPRWGASRC